MLLRETQNRKPRRTKVLNECAPFKCLALRMASKTRGAASIHTGVVPDTNSVSVTTPGSSRGPPSSQATMRLSASKDLGFSFVSDPSPTTSSFAEIGIVKMKSSRETLNPAFRRGRTHR